LSTFHGSNHKTRGGSAGVLVVREDQPLGHTDVLAEGFEALTQDYLDAT